MNRRLLFVMKYVVVVCVCLLSISEAGTVDGKAKLRVVTTLPDYAMLARRIGGDRIAVEAIVLGHQDAHFIRPKPSFVNMVKCADILISTGLDMELWLPTVVNKSGNGKVRSGQPGYVAVAKGMHLLEKPKVLSRIEGGLHIYGNPHVTCSPVNMKMAARNITTGLIKNDPEGKGIYEKNLKHLLDEFDKKLFGEKLVDVLGGNTLCDLAKNGKLIDFLRQHEYQGKPLSNLLGGWMKQMQPLWGTKIVTYHKNWVYFITLFGLEEAGTIEPKPGIPPSPKHVADLVKLMKERDIRIILAANYFDKQKIKAVAHRVNAEPVIVPLYVTGAEGTKDYFQLVDYWIDGLLKAAKKKDIMNI